MTDEFDVNNVDDPFDEEHSNEDETRVLPKVDPTAVMPEVEETFDDEERTATESLSTFQESKAEVDAYRVLDALNEPEEVVEEKKNNIPLVVGCIAAALILVIGGLALYMNNKSDEDEPSPVAYETDVAATEDATDNGTTDRPKEESDEEKNDEGSEKVDEDESTEVETPKAPGKDKVVRKKETDNNTIIYSFFNPSAVPYEQYNKDSKKVSQIEGNTGNGYNDDYLQYNVDLGVRKNGGLNPNDYAESDIKTAMGTAIDKAGLDIEAPDKPDYKNARKYSSGYTLWNLSDGYTMIYGGGEAKGIFSKKDKDDDLAESYTKSEDVLIPQKYADRFGVSFGNLPEKVSGSEEVEDSDWWLQ